MLDMLIAVGSPLIAALALLCLLYWRIWPQDFKERILTYETLKGIYFITAGMAMLWIVVVNERFAFKATIALFAWYVACEGMRKVQVNRIKQAAAKQKLVNKRLRK